MKAPRFSLLPSRTESLAPQDTAEAQGIALPPAGPWQVPPLGSIGDAWDNVIQLPGSDVPLEPAGRMPSEVALPKSQVGLAPRAAAEGAEAPPMTAAQERGLAAIRLDKPRRHREDVTFLQWRPRIHWAAVIGWVFLACSLFSTGPEPVRLMMSYFGGLTLLCGVATIALTRTIHKESGGFRHGIALFLLGALMVGLEASQPKTPLFTTWVRTAPSVASGDALTAAERVLVLDQRMDRMARIVACSYHRLRGETTSEGRNGANGDVRPGSSYFAISTLKKPDPQAIDTGYGFSDYRQKDLPKDPFADDPSATFGVYLTEKHILIYSIGPDGIWDINPRKPVDFRSANPLVELAELQVPGGSESPSGTGDIIKMYDLEAYLEWADCLGLRQELRGERENPGFVF